MKQSKYLFVLTIIAVFAIISSCKSNTSEVNTDSSVSKTKESSPVEKPQTENAVVASEKANLDILKTYNGKYPYKVKLFENKAFAERLEKLVGKRYSVLKSVWAVETPMEVSEKQFIASACEAHNCGGTNFIVVIDFEKNVMFAGIREEDNVETYSEDGTYPQVMMSWREGDK